MHRDCLAASILITVILLFASAARGQTAPVANLQSNPEQNQYLTGGQIQITAPVNGDVTAAGNRVTIASAVSDDVIAAAETVAVEARIGDDLHAAGRQVTLASPIGGDAVLAGETIRFTPAASVGNAFLFGRDAIIAGQVLHNLTANAASVTIAGEVRGNATINAARLEVLPTAIIHGTLQYRGNNAHIDPRAQIGRVVQLPSGQRPSTIVSRLFGSLMFVVVFAVVAAVLYLVFPRFSVATARLIATDPWKCLGLGLGFMILMPFVLGLLMVTVIGIPLALILLALYLFLPLFGFLTGVLYLGEMGLDRLRRSGPPSKGLTVLSMVVALAVLALVGYVPVMGGLVFIGVALFGLGALLLQFYRDYRGPTAAAPTGQVAPAPS